MKRVPLLLLLPVLLLGCGDSSTSAPDGSDARALPQEVLPYVDDVVASSNEFAFDLYKELRDVEGNFFYSPFSVACALSMTYAGAAGITAEEMARVLHIRDDEHWHEVFGALQASIDRGAELQDYELSLANRIWPQRGYPFLESFITLLSDYYGSGVEYLNYDDDPEMARMTINHWVEEQTHERIKNLLKPGVINPTTVLVLTNAIYFKGTWLFRFDPTDTYEGTFTLADGATVTTPLMALPEVTLRAGFLADATLLSLPYEGDDISMIIVLPREHDGLPELEQSISYDQIAVWLESMEETTFDAVILPKFSFTSEFRLNDILIALGMPSAFSALADFSGITGVPGLVIDTVVHKAFVEVNEEGTEAAAATAVVMRDSLPSAFVADHPFLFLIYDHLTEEILFVGRVETPVT